MSKGVLFAVIIRLLARGCVNTKTKQMHWSNWIGFTFGGIALLLGVIGDWFNFKLGRQKKRGEALRVSPLVLAPFLLNSFGLFMLFLGVHGYNVSFFLIGIVLLFVLHILCLISGGLR